MHPPDRFSSEIPDRSAAARTTKSGSVLHRGALLFLLALPGTQLHAETVVFTYTGAPAAFDQPDLSTFVEYGNLSFDSSVGPEIPISVRAEVQFPTAGTQIIGASDAQVRLMQVPGRLAWSWGTYQVDAVIDVTVVQLSQSQLFPGGQDYVQFQFRFQDLESLGGQFYDQGNAITDYTVFSSNAGIGLDVFVNNPGASLETVFDLLAAGGWDGFASAMLDARLGSSSDHLYDFYAAVTPSASEVTVTVIPEPSTWAAIAGALTLLPAACRIGLLGRARRRAALV